MLNVERIVLTGAIAALGPPLLEAVKTSLARHALAPLAAMTRVDLVPERHDAVLLGIAQWCSITSLGCCAWIVRRTCSTELPV
jgi:predicted NBD/HSP70 family sugar kinase